MLVVFDFASVWLLAWLRIWTRNGVDARTPVIILLAGLTAAAGWFVLKRVPIRGLGEAAASWGLALLLGPAVFVPLHYVTQGYLTAMSNLISLVAVTVLPNALLMFWAYAIGREFAVTPKA